MSLRFTKLPGGIHKKSDVELHESLGLDSEPEIIPVEVYIDLTKVVSVMPSMYNGVEKGVSLGLSNGDSFWIDIEIEEFMQKYSIQL